MCVHKTDDGKCMLFSEAGAISWCVDGPCEHEVRSMGDKIRAMSDVELAGFLAGLAHNVKVNTFNMIQKTIITEVPAVAIKEHLKWIKSPEKKGGDNNGN